MNHMAHPLSFANISVVQRKLANFAISKVTDTDWILGCNF